MSYLINRNPSGRIICLHSLLRYLYNKFKTEPFTLSDLKYDSQSKFNIHQTCPLLVKLPSISYKVCPYLENPLSDAKCYLTQSVQEDTQKSKSVSDAFNALEGMEFIRRVDKRGVITKEGIDFISDEFESENTLKRLQSGMLSYGPFVGLIHEISNKTRDIYRSEIELGYPITNEKVEVGGRKITLSTGSQQDTITRTRSVLFIWATTSGFLLPESIKEPSNTNVWHAEMLPYTESKKWTINKFNIRVPKMLFSKKLFVKNPLSYNAMTKSTKALRERNQEEERIITLKYEPIITNRRFALVYGLAKKSEKNQTLNFSGYLKELSKYPELFVVNQKDFERAMEIELSICSVCGIPFTRDKFDLTPLTLLDIKELSSGAPLSLIKILDQIIMKI